MSKPKKARSISVHSDIYLTLRKMRTEMQEALGGRVTFNMVIQRLLNEHVDLLNVRGELKEIKSEAEETQNYIKQMLRLALETKSPLSINSNQPVLHEPPRPPEIKKVKRKEYRAPSTGNLKRDYVQEISHLFTGEILKPSDVLNITKPEHQNGRIEEITDDTTVPDIFERSTARRFPKQVEEGVNVS